jgi:hypothetical protein
MVEEHTCTDTLISTNVHILYSYEKLWETGPTSLQIVEVVKTSCYWREHRLPLKQIRLYEAPKSETYGFVHDGLGEPVPS